MKKINIYLLVAMATALMATGCSQKQTGEAAAGAGWEEGRDSNLGADDGRISGIDRAGTISAEELARQRAAERSTALRATRVVYFNYDSSDVNPEGREVLQAHAEWLASRGQVRVRLEGHADERGSREYNLALGQRRADSVRQLLTVYGVSPASLDAISYGEEKPASQSRNESAWAANRRVEIIY